MIEEEIAGYYSHSFQQYGRQPRGVDWKDDAAQQRRFEALTQHIPVNMPGTVLDFGCGYGALFSFLTKKGYEIEYHGFDIAKDVLAATKSYYSDAKNAQFHTSLPENLRVQYAVLNGVFHVKLHQETNAWEQHVLATLQRLLPYVTTSLSINFLSLKSDPEKRKGTLFYAHPVKFTKTVRSRLGCQVTMVEHPDLYEFVMNLRPKDK